VIIEEGESLSAYSRFCRLRPDPQELVARLCIPGRGFELNIDGLPLKILRKNLTTLAQTRSILSFSNLAPTSHTFDITLDRARLIYGIIQKMDMNLGYIILSQISMIAQHDSSRVGFPALIIALFKTRGVTSDSLSFESLSPSINLAYVKKNCWNLDDPTVTFRGAHKAKDKRYEAPPSFAFPTSTPSTSTTAAFAPASALVSFGPSTFSSESLFAMLQSLHKGQIIIMQSLQSSG